MRSCMAGVRNFTTLSSARPTTGRGGAIITDLPFLNI